MCEQTHDVFYFGEDVDKYSKGVISSHSGAWRVGERNATPPGLMMPGNASQGMEDYQEIAPDLAMDRAEIVNLDFNLITPAGEFSNCLKAKEGTALNILEVEYKTYAVRICQ